MIFKYLKNGHKFPYVFGLKDKRKPMNRCCGFYFDMEKNSHHECEECGSTLEVILTPSEKVKGTSNALNTWERYQLREYIKYMRATE